MIAEEFIGSKSARSYHYFREKTCYDLCRPQDREFWTNLVLRVSHDQPVIKQILIALGSLHESLEIAYSSWGDKKDQPLNIFSLEKYTAAIKQLKADSSNLTIEVVLVSCVLLVYFETLQNDNRSAMSLLQSGLGLLPQWRAQSEVKDHIVRIFARIRLQALTFFKDAARESSPQLSELSSTDQAIVAISSSFQNLPHAKVCFDSITEEAYRVMNPVLCAADYPLTFKLLFRFRALLDLWFAKFNNFIIKQRRNSIPLRKELVFLRIQYRVASLLTAASPASGQIRFDKNLEDFESIISDVATLLNHTNVDQSETSEEEEDEEEEEEEEGEEEEGEEEEGEKEEGEKEEGEKEEGEKEEGEKEEEENAEVSCDLQKHSVVPALLVCAFFCRCPSLRRKAVTLLSIETWCEPSWNSFAAEKVAAWIFATEEHEAKNPRTRNDVPQSCRIRLLEIVRLGQNLPTQDHQEVELGPKATVPQARGHVRIDLAFALESQRVLLRYIGVLRALAHPM